MRAVIFEEFGGPEVLREREIDPPPLGPNSVLVRMQYSGVNPGDTRIRRGEFTQMARHVFPVVPGWEGSGVVEQVGFAVQKLQPGMPVYGLFRHHYIGDGSYAELGLADERDLLLRPDDLAPEAAGAVSAAGLTALMAVEEGLKLQAGETVLVVGAAGGVGHLVVQLAAATGAMVVGVARTANHEFLRSLGATEVIDYQRDDLAAAVRRIAPDGVDTAVDTVGGPAQAQLPPLVRVGGRVASCVHPPFDDAFERRSQHFSQDFLQATERRVERLAKAVTDGLRPHVTEVLPLAHARRAHELIESGHTRGKIVLEVS